MSEFPRFSRREVLQVATGGVLMSFANLATAADVPAGGLPYGDPLWNRDTYAKLQGNLDFEQQKVGWYAGKVYGVRDGEPCASCSAWRASRSAGSSSWKTAAGASSCARWASTAT
jgi:hypothetical protein